MAKPTSIKIFGGENYSLVTIFDTKHEAEANAKLQRRQRYKARIWRWKRDDGKTLYAIYIRRGKRFRF